jgi:hypothetical protein
VEALGAAEAWGSEEGVEDSVEGAVEGVAEETYTVRTELLRT